MPPAKRRALRFLPRSGAGAVIAVGRVRACTHRSKVSNCANVGMVRVNTHPTGDMMKTANLGAVPHVRVLSD